MNRRRGVAAGLLLLCLASCSVGEKPEPTSGAAAKTTTTTTKAVPIMAALKIMCDHIESLAPIGEFLGT